MISEAMKELFLETLEETSSIAIAQRVAGVSANWYYEHIKLHPEFKPIAEAAQAKALLAAARSFKSGFDEDWRAGEAFLKRRLPEEWGDKTKVDQTIHSPLVDALTKYIEGDKKEDEAT